MRNVMSLDDMRLIQLEILSHIKNVCEVNNIKFYLGGGTLLGAIRHKGYIPWDDDIDIFMFREDYLNLLNLLRKSKDNEFKVLSSSDNSDYYYPFAKVVKTSTYMVEENTPEIKGYGVYVDVFPIDGLPNNRLGRRIDFTPILIMLKMHNLSTTNKSSGKSSILKKFTKYCLWTIFRPIGYQRFLKKIDKRLLKYSEKGSKFVACCVGSYGLREVVPKSIFDETILVRFEDDEYYAPKGFDKYLSNLYGDYMTLPPAEKRVRNHSNIAYWLD